MLFPHLMDKFNGAQNNIDQISKRFWSERITTEKMNPLNLKLLQSATMKSNIWMLKLVKLLLLRNPKNLIKLCSSMLKKRRANIYWLSMIKIRLKFTHNFQKMLACSSKTFSTLQLIRRMVFLLATSFSIILWPEESGKSTSEPRSLFKDLNTRLPLISITNTFYPLPLWVIILSSSI